MKHRMEVCDVTNATSRVRCGSIVLRSHLYHPKAGNYPRWLALLVILYARNPAPLVVRANLMQHSHHVASHVHQKARGCGVYAIGLRRCRSCDAKYSAKDCKSRNDCCCKGILHKPWLEHYKFKGCTKKFSYFLPSSSS